MKTDIYKVLSESLKLISPILNRKMVEVQFATDGGEAYKKIFATDFDSIIYNLVINSIESFEETKISERQITIRVESDDDKIGIIDDDQSKVTQMITMIRLCCNDEEGHPIKEKYANYELIPIELSLLDNTDDMVEQIVEKRLDAVIIDYKLSSQKAVSYSGVSLAKELCLRLYGFPIFVLTTYKDDLFDHELFDS